MIIKIKKNNKIMHGYRHQRKVMYYYNFLKLKKQITLIADRNPDRDNLFTPELR